MDVLNVGDLSPGDSTTDLKLNSIWENLRRYCFVGNVITALFMAYFSLSQTTINCIPRFEENNQEQLSTPQASFINTYCSYNLPLYENIVGIGPLCHCITIMIYASFWTRIPAIITSFQTFVDFVKIVESLNLSSSRFCELSSRIINSSSTEECRQVRKACSILWKCKMNGVVKESYYERNIFLLVALLLSTGASAYELYLQFFAIQAGKGKFKCSWDTEDEAFIFGTKNDTRIYLCTHHTTKKILLFAFAFPVLFMFQFAFVLTESCLLYYRMRKYDKKFKLLSQEAKQAAENFIFIVQFLKFSKLSEKVEEIVYYIFDDAIAKIKVNLKEAFLEDSDMISIYRFSNKERDIDVLGAIISNMNDDFLVTSLCHENIVQHFTYLKPRVAFQYLRKFVHYLCEHKYWELLANLLVAKSSDWIGDNELPDTTSLESVKINLNEIGQPYESQRSFLFYILSGNLQHTDGAQFIIKSLKLKEANAKKCHVHLDGKYKLASTFLSENEPSRIYCYDASKDSSVAKVIGINVFTHGSQSQIQFGKLVGELKNTTEMFYDKVDNVRYKSIWKVPGYQWFLEKFAERISRYRFDKWEENNQGLAVFAKAEKQWIVLVALLNAYIIDKESGNPQYHLLDIGCDAKGFTVNLEQENTLPFASILYYALRKPTYQPRFQFTAIRHILRCTSGRVHYVRTRKGTIVNAFKFVIKNEDLKEEEKNILLNLLKQSMSPPQSPMNTQDDNIESSRVSTATVENTSRRRSGAIVDIPDEDRPLLGCETEV